MEDTPWRIVEDTILWRIKSLFEKNTKNIIPQLSAVNSKKWRMWRIKWRIKTTIFTIIQHTFLCQVKLSTGLFLTFFLQKLVHFFRGEYNKKTGL